MPPKSKDLIDQQLCLTSQASAPALTRRQTHPLWFDGRANDGGKCFVVARLRNRIMSSATKVIFNVVEELRSESLGSPR